MSKVVIYDNVNPPYKVTDYFESVNTPDYSGGNVLVNPSLASVAAVPVKYWKVSGGAVMEMSAAEKQAVDDAADLARSPMGYPVFSYNSAGIYQCDNADWPVNRAVPVIADPANNSIKVMQFDNGVASGVGFNFICPSGLSCLIVDLRGRCSSVPSTAAKTLICQLRFRIIPDGSAINSWGQKALEAVTLSQDVLYHKYLWVKNLATANISDKLIQVQFVRRGDTDTLEYPWYAERITFKFS